MIWKMGAGAAALCVAATFCWAETPVERGEYLVRGPMSCGNCHTPQGPDGPDMTKELAGGQLLVDEPAMQADSANITPAGEVGAWTDAELRKAIREGIRPDGSLIGPPMPFGLYRDLSDTDLDAIVAFLRTAAAGRERGAEVRLQHPAAAGLRAAGRARRRHAPRADGGVRQVPGRADRALRRVPHADGAAGADVRHGARAGGLRVSRALGGVGGAEHHLGRGRAEGLYRRRDRRDDHRGRAAGRSRRCCRRCPMPGSPG